MPKQISLVNEAVSLFCGQREVKIWIICLCINTLHDDRSIGLTVSKFCQIKPDLSPVHIDHNAVLDPTIDIPFAIFGGQINVDYRLSRRQGRRNGGDGRDGRKRRLYGDCRNLRRSSWRADRAAKGRPDNEEKNNQKK